MSRKNSLPSPEEGSSELTRPPELPEPWAARPAEAVTPGARLGDLQIESLLLDLFRYLPLKIRWTTVALVCSAWHRLADLSVAMEDTIDLTWCTGHFQLQHAINRLKDPKTSPDVKLHSKMRSLCLFGVKVNRELLERSDFRLEQLKLENKALENDSFSVVCKGCPNLRTFSLTSHRVGSEGFHAMSENLTSIIDLDLSQCTRLSDEGLIPIILRSPHLRRLNVSRCARVSNESIFYLARHCPALTDLNIDRCLKVTSQAIEALARSIPRLQRLDLSNLPKLTSAALVALRRYQQYQELECVLLRGCTGVKDDGILALLSSHPRLSLLSLSGLHLTSKSFTFIGEHGGNLEELQLNQCSALSDADVNNITKGTPKLKTLGLAVCTRLTDDSLFSLALNCPDLRSVALAMCYNITDTGLLRLLEGCQKLNALHLRGCNRLSLLSFKALSHRKEPLTFISLAGVTDNSTTALYAKMLHDSHPYCHVGW